MSCSHIVIEARRDKAYNHYLALPFKENGNSWSLISIDKYIVKLQHVVNFKEPSNVTI